MSLFNQLLQHFPNLEFAGLVKKHDAERAAKGFSCRAQLVWMLFCQLAHADSPCEICNGLACCLGKLVHLGIGVAPNEATLAYANRHRPAKLYAELFYTARGRFRDEKGTGRASSAVCAWTCFLGRNSAACEGRRQGPRPARSRRLSATLRPDHRGAAQRDEDGRCLFPLNPGSVIVMDRGYNDYTLFRK